MPRIPCLHEDVGEPAELVAAIRARRGGMLLVELVAIVATYNMVSRFLVALGIEPEAG